MAITYHTEKEGFSYKGRRLTTRWLNRVVEAEGGVTGQINIAFCSDEYMLQTNRKYLGHDYLTDIITFDYCLNRGGKRIISGDLAIGVECVRENGDLFKTGFDRELKRVIVHGVLHLLGYKDKKEAEKTVMRAKEDVYLSMLDEMAENRP